VYEIKTSFWYKLRSMREFTGSDLGEREGLPSSANESESGRSDGRCGVLLVFISGVNAAFVRDMQCA
jgi:hypothetical protein